MKNNYFYDTGYFDGFMGCALDYSRCQDQCDYVAYDNGYRKGLKDAKELSENE